MEYEANPKHKRPSPGKHGSICPRGVDAQRLLDDSILDGRKRYATDGLEAFCAQCHDRDADLWHGYPIGWNEVPPRIVKEWLEKGRVDRRTVRRQRRRNR
ncbi:MAG TPA: hypothetical protein VIL36_19880 [Acidimicrobiales bacterium]